MDNTRPLALWLLIALAGTGGWPVLTRDERGEGGEPGRGLPPLLSPCRGLEGVQAFLSSALPGSSKPAPSPLQGAREQRPPRPPVQPGSRPACGSLQ